MRVRTIFLGVCISAGAACDGDAGLEPGVIVVATATQGTGGPTGDPGTGGLETGGGEASSGGSTGAAPAKKCWCHGYKCVEHNAQGQEVSFYAVDISHALGEGDKCEVTQLVKDLLYYECVNSVIHPDWADWSADVKFTCEVVDAT